MANARRLAELGMAAELAKETAAQITAGAGGAPAWTAITGKPTTFPPTRGVAVANASDAATVITQLNALLASLRASGAIAT